MNEQFVECVNCGRKYDAVGYANHDCVKAPTKVEELTAIVLEGRKQRLAALREVREMVRNETNDLWNAVEFQNDSFTEAACQSTVSNVADCVLSRIDAMIAKEER